MMHHDDDVSGGGWLARSEGMDGSRKKLPSTDGVGWVDFPRGLRVLLLDDDVAAAAQTKDMLERMDYAVSLFQDEDDAKETVSKATGVFHLAIVEVMNTRRSEESFGFLEMAGHRGLQTIVISSVRRLSTVLRCIALGAAVFLHKPVSEEKLRNIWQHVVHKAFSAAPNALSNSLRPIKDAVASILRNQAISSKYFSVQNACPGEEEEEEVVDSEHANADTLIECRVPTIEKTSPIITARWDCQKKNSKVDWTPELHKRFVQAVEQLGIDHAIPSKILRLMKVEGLTRHNIASHLQKYRMRRRHVLLPPPKINQGSRRPQHRDPTTVHAQRPMVAFPAAVVQYSNYGYRPSQPQVYSVWGHPSGIQSWQQPTRPVWPWKGFTTMHAYAAWGCPVLHQQNPLPAHHQVHPHPPPLSPHPQNLPQVPVIHEDHGRAPRATYDDLHLDEEAVDKMVREAITKPWLPLPLGLKPPSVDAVLAELQREGVSNISPPPPSSC